MIKDFRYGNVFLDEKGAKNTKFNYHSINSIVGYDKFDYIDYVDSNRPIKELNEQNIDFHEVFKSIIKDSAFSRKIVTGCGTPTALSDDWENNSYFSGVLTDIDDRVVATPSEIVPFIIPRDYDTLTYPYATSASCESDSFMLESGLLADTTTGDFYRVSTYLGYVEQALCKILDLDTGVNTQRRGLFEFGIDGNIDSTTLLGLTTGTYTFTFDVPKPDGTEVQIEIDITVDSVTTTVQDFVSDLRTELNTKLNSILGIDECVFVGINSYTATFKDIAIYYNKYLNVTSESYIHLASVAPDIYADAGSIFNGKTLVETDAVYNDYIRLEVGDVKRYKISITRNSNTIDPMLRSITAFEFDLIEELYDKLIDNASPRSDFNLEDTYDLSDILFLKLDNRFLIKGANNYLVYNKVTNLIEVYYSASAILTQTEFDVLDCILLYTTTDTGASWTKNDVDMTGITKIINNTYVVPDAAARATIAGVGTPLNIGDRVFQEDTSFFYKWNGTILIQEV